MHEKQATDALRGIAYCLLVIALACNIMVLSVAATVCGLLAVFLVGFMAVLLIIDLVRAL